MIKLIVLLLIILPSVYSNELMFGTISGKMFVFLYVVLVIAILGLIKAVVQPVRNLRFCKIDFLLLIWVVYVLLNGWFQQMPMSGRLFELLGLVVFYILLRQVEPARYGLLLLAMAIGGVVQAVYGNLQLWGYCSSHHPVFKITGCFFNPGPYAGYLASVFPAVLGFFLFSPKLRIANNTAGQLQGAKRLFSGFALFLLLLILLPAQSRAAWMAVAVAVAVFAFFSYPAQVLPIKMSVILYLAFITSLSANQLWSVSSKQFIPVKYVVALLLAIGLMVTVPCLKKSRIAWKSWKEAHHLYTLGGYTGCLPHYEKAWPILKTDGDYLTNYGKALSMANEHQQAIEVLRQAVFYYPNIVVYTALGDSYKALGKTVEAEQAYLTAYYMNPSRFYAQYLLAKLYDETGQTEKATDIANELLQKEVKIPSVAIKEIKEEMRKIIEN